VQFLDVAGLRLLQRGPRRSQAIGPAEEKRFAVEPPFGFGLPAQ
jgi:hypothetical protein